MLKKILTFTSVISAVVVTVILSVTNPVSAGPFGILVMFICSYALLIGIITYSLHYGSRIVAHLSSVFIPRKPFQTLSFRRSYYYSTVIAAAPIMVIGLQSVGSVGIYELFLVSIFIVLGCLYVSKRIG